MKSLIKFVVASIDFVILSSIFLVAYWLRFELSFLPQRPVEPLDLYIRMSFLVASFGVLTFFASDLYDLDSSAGIDQYFAIARALTLSSLSIMIVVYVLRGYISQHDTHLYSRLVIGIFWIISILVMIIWRWGFNRLVRITNATGKGLRRVLLLGGDDTTFHLFRLMQEQPDLGYYPVGCLTDHTYSGETDKKIKVFGNIYDLAEILKREQIDEAILGTVQLKSEMVAMLMNTCLRADVKFSMVPSLFEILTSRTQTREIGGIPIFSLEEPLLKTWNRRLKRFVDVTVGIAAGILFAPIWIPVAIAIKFESKGPILFTQQRMGKGERIFGIYKFRSMCQDAERIRGELEHLNEADGPIFKIRNDPRTTKVGRWIRRWSLDELPQLINVMKGEMSLVGPRPFPVSESEQFDTFQRRRYDVLPGMTGLAQVNGRSDLSIDEILRLDLYYIENWSVGMDLKIMFKTFPALLTRNGAY